MAAAQLFRERTGCFDVLITRGEHGMCLLNGPDAVHYAAAAREVADVFLVPLAFILDPANHTRESMRHDGQERSFYVLPFPGRRIWGATAGMLVSLARALV